MIQGLHLRPVVERPKRARVIFEYVVPLDDRVPFDPEFAKELKAAASRFQEEYDMHAWLLGISEADRTYIPDEDQWFEVKFEY